jgi:spore coat protein CotH
MKICALIVAVFNVFALFGQNLPPQIRFSDDGHFLITGDNESEGIYDESKVEELRLYFTQPDFWQQMTNYYNTKIDIPATLIVDGHTYDSVGVRFKGQTSYLFNNSQKKSFNISMDYHFGDQRLDGYKTFNLNNSFQDASFMRETFFLHHLRKHTPAAKSTFVRLYINDEDWGLYQHVQQLNKDFLKEWWLSNDGNNWRADRPDGLFGPGTGLWGDGTAAMNYLQDSIELYQIYYTLKSSDDEEQAWHQLNQACKILNQTPLNQLHEIGAEFFDLDRILWHLACEIAFSDDDSYAYKGKMDYYVYQDVETGRFATYDYDGNSVMKNNAVNWSPFYNEQKVNYPLLNRLLAIPELRQRYLAHLRTILKFSFDETYNNSLIDSYDQLIRATVQADPKKTTTYNQYINELNVLKNFMRNRKNFLLAHVEVNAQSPEFTDVYYESTNGKWIAPDANSAGVIKAKINHPFGISYVNLYYGTDVYGRFEKTRMNDLGIDGDEIGGDGIYTGLIPPQKSGTWVRSYIEAVAANGPSTCSFFPEGAEHQVMIYQVKPTIRNATIVINEFMASNSTGSGIQDEHGQHDDWIELYNLTNERIDLSGYFLSDNESRPSKWTFPDGVYIEADEYLIIWADDETNQGNLHSNFKLSASGEVILLSDRDTILMDSVVFGVQSNNMTMARKPNGEGPFVISEATFAANNDLSSKLDHVHTGYVDWTMYPNPVFSGILIVESLTQTAHSLEIRDTNGKSLYRNQFYERAEIDISSLPSGLYFVSVESFVRKLLIMR